MKYIICILISFQIIFSCNHSFADVPVKLLSLIKDSWQCAELSPRENVVGLCYAINDVQGMWFWLNADSQILLVTNMPQTASNIVSILSSPDRKKLAIYGADEGHPLISVIDGVALYEGSSAEMFHRGVYPGYLNPVCWYKQYLLLESDQDLTAQWFNGEIQKTKNYLLEPVTGLIIKTDLETCAL